MKVELGTKGEIVLILLIAAIAGALLDGLSGSYSYSYMSEPSAHRENFMIAAGSSVTAQSLREGTSTSYSFPPREFVFEWVEFEVDIIDASGVLQVNFTRDGKALRTEYVHGSERIISSGYGEYRLKPSSFDVVLRAYDEEVRIRYLLINISRGIKEYHPAFNAIWFSVFTSIFIVLPLYLKKPKHPK